MTNTSKTVLQLLRALTSSSEQLHGSHYFCGRGIIINHHQSNSLYSIVQAIEAQNIRKACSQQDRTKLTPPKTPPLSRYCPGRAQRSSGATPCLTWRGARSRSSIGIPANGPNSAAWTSLRPRTRSLASGLPACRWVDVKKKRKRRTFLHPCHPLMTRDWHFCWPAGWGWLSL